LVTLVRAVSWGSRGQKSVQKSEREMGGFPSDTWLCREEAGLGIEGERAEEKGV
jgi:hypothetical protein